MVSDGMGKVCGRYHSKLWTWDEAGMLTTVPCHLVVAFLCCGSCRQLCLNFLAVQLWSLSLPRLRANCLTILWIQLEVIQWNDMLAVQISLANVTVIWHLSSVLMMIMMEVSGYGYYASTQVMMILWQTVFISRLFVATYFVKHEIGLFLNCE